MPHPANCGRSCTQAVTLNVADGHSALQIVDTDAITGNGLKQSIGKTYMHGGITVVTQ